MSDTPKTVAEAAYCELLAMPMPRTLLDFRRAIVMAALVGRQLEADFAGSPWQTTPPTVPGSWEMACAETDFEPSRVRVFEQHGVLWVEEAGGATFMVDTYHHGLIDTRWRLVANAGATSERERLPRSISEERLRATLQLIAAPRRADGTWNRDREACRQLAREALDDADHRLTPDGQHDDEPL